MTLRSRLERLEAVQKGQAQSFILIVRTIVGQGDDNEPVATIQDEQGRRFTQEPGETEDDFVDRVARLQGWPDQTTRLILLPAKEPIEN